MKKRISTSCLSGAIALLVLAVLASPAAAFGLKDLDSTFIRPDNSMDTQAGSHPFAQVVNLNFDTVPHVTSFSTEVPDGDVKEVIVSLPPGFVGDPTVVPTCSDIDFIQESCPPATRVGTNDIVALSQGEHVPVPVYSVDPPPGVVMRLGFLVIGTPVMVDLSVNPSPPYNVIATAAATPNEVPLYSTTMTVWGVPGSPVHDGERGCGNTSCKIGLSEEPFLTLPRACEGPLDTVFKGDSWQEPAVWAEPAPLLTHDNSEPPRPQGMTGCSRLGFDPTISATPTTKASSSPTGLDFSLDVEDEGLDNPSEAAVADSDIRKTEVTLPEGFSINPSIAEGLNVCTPAQLDRETAFSEPGEGCPEASKIGSVEVETPLLDENVNGALYQAAPYDNPFHSLVALYVVIKNPKLGILLKQPLRVDSDPVTGRITTVAEEMPQLPFSHFRLHFREGTRSPLASPPTCGSHTVTAKLYPWSGAAPVTTTSSFEIISGPESQPCPTGGTPPFHPGLIAGSINNAAGRYSPFNVRLSRTDSEQEITHFSIKLPPGITGKLAGIPFCSDAAIAAAKAREGQPHGAQEELDSPSCPATSEVGHTLVGSGVGPSLAYVPGKLYLAGPYNGAPLSIVAVTAAKAGPFDLGTVVVRDALRINPETAEVFIDATGSDPIPHIIHGIPVHLRDIRIYTDRPDFVLNPTSCNQTSTASTVLGSGTDFASEADDQPITVATRYQAADCASLPYKPSIQLKLRGGSKRGGNPALTAILKPRPGDANSKKVSVALPHSEFLDQAHIKTICTRVQFKAGAGNGAQCPAASVYGSAKAWTPLLSEPLEGPIFLRSSEHPLPDLVLALHGLVDFTAVGRIDSVNGGIRNTFEAIPDAPITKVEVMFPGGKKSLLENSTNICAGKHNATVEFGAQSGKEAQAKVALKPQCKGKAHKHKKKAAKKNRGR